MGPINDTKKVYVVIDEDFSKIPFSLFIDEDGRFAAEKHSFVVLDSLVSFKFLKKRKKKLNSKMSFVGIGNPALDGSSENNSFENLFTSRGFADVDKIKQLSNLPETKNELEEISSIFSSSILFWEMHRDILKVKMRKKLFQRVT